MKPGRPSETPSAILIGMLIASFVCLAPGKNARALDIDWTLNVRILTSDNIDRFPPGLERSGNLYSVTPGIRLKKETGDFQYTISGVAGEERIRNSTDVENETYRLGGDFSWIKAPIVPK